MPFFNLKNLFTESENTYNGKASPPSEKTPDSEALPPIIGLDMVGRGVRLKPHQVYELKDVLLKRTKHKQIFNAIETGQSYLVPADGYAVDASHPFPTDQHRIIIEDSWEEFDKHFKIDNHLATSYHVFNVEVRIGHIKQLYSEEDSYYAAKISFIPFWTLYLPNVTGLSDQLDLDLPLPFQYKHRKEYERFFEQYGTHYVKRAWIGGKIILAFAIAKTAITKAELRKTLNACYATESDHLDTNVKETLEKLHKESERVVLGQGGNPAKLGALRSLQESSYNDWLETLKENPKVVEFEVAGIWTLIHDIDQAKALLEAYKAITTFIPLSAVLRFDEQQVLFIKGKECTCYNLETRKTGEAKPIIELWPALLEIPGFDAVDAAIKGIQIKSSDGKDISKKLFFLKGDQCVRLDIEANRIDNGYPKPIAEEWPGVTFERIDAVLPVDSETIYFFMEKQYIRYNPVKHQVESGYPQQISARWNGITFDKIDAAFLREDKRVYFFRRDEYILYDTVKHLSEWVYPKFLVGNYIEDWNLFD
ncbi:hemopexin repeat-containing protein [Candidatus Parabeggiatoa sp. HSG14]|uniref:hemopexin repeat-containing protein n=1 Tax=Candidatus Parabeggiatoa sp. HSG14 TaxID=3055593 RepID=UPI0025A733FF|nr:hemopexin repeat-containing protein [Thiotrichales bacterium HSG14]